MPRHQQEPPRRGARRDTDMGWRSPYAETEQPFEPTQPTPAPSHPSGPYRDHPEPDPGVEPGLTPPPQPLQAPPGAPPIVTPPDPSPSPPIGLAVPEARAGLAAATVAS